ILEWISISVTGRQRAQVPPVLDQRKYANSLILGVVNISSLDKRPDQQSRNTRTGSPLLVDNRRSYVIPETTILVISDHNTSILAVGAVQHVIDQLDSMVLAVGHIRIARVLVVDTQRLYKGYAGQRTILGGSDKFLLILQVLFLCLRSVSIVSEI